MPFVKEHVNYLQGCKKGDTVSLTVKSAKTRFVLTAVPEKK
jgi:hypothetical protein